MVAHRPDIVHFHNTLPLVSPAAMRMAHDLGAAVVLSLHNYRLLCPAGTFLRDGHVCEDCLAHSLVRSVVHACYRGSRAQTLTVAAMLAIHRRLGTWSRCIDAFIALTSFMKEKMIAGGLPAERIHVRHNPVLAGSRPGPQARELTTPVGEVSVQDQVPASPVSCSTGSAVAAGPAGPVIATAGAAVSSR